MKIRSGFVSNSSSSSFTVFSKKELTEELLLEIFKIPEGHPLTSLVKDICKCIKRQAKPMDLEEIQEEIEFGSSRAEELLEKSKQGYYCYTGYFGDDSSYGAESFLCTNGIKAETEDFKIECEGGY